jgi:predicted O-methyltransferase YrrM
MQPNNLFGRMRRALAAARDRAFEERSPIPIAPRELVERICSADVILPPLRDFAPGNQSVAGLVVLISIAKALGARTTFEIGTYNGLTALALARNLSGATIHTLDLPPATEPALPVFGPDRFHIDRTGRRIYEGTPEHGRIRQHFGDSATFDFSPFSAICDLVYVDGAHSLAYVAHDSASARILVSEGGAIVWDDYWRQVPDVPRYLDAREPLRRELVRFPGTRLVAWFSRSGPLGTSSARSPDLR